MEVGHVSHLVMLLINVHVTKPSKNGNHLALEQMSLFFSQTPLLTLLFCVFETDYNKKEGEKKVWEKLRPLLHIPQRGTTVESAAEL